MHNSNCLKVFGICAGIISAALGSALSLANPSGVESSPEYLVSLQFPEAPNTEPPRSTAAGGRRGPCKKSRLPFEPDRPPSESPLSPDGSKSLRNLVALMLGKTKTSDSTPPFFFYIPITSGTSAQFIIQDEQRKEIERQEIKLPFCMIAGIITISPKKELDIGKKYRWTFTLRASDPVKIEGEIERVDPDPDTKSRLDATKDDDYFAKARIYAKAGLWPETFDNAAQVRVSRFQEWEELLRSVGLQDFALQPILGQAEIEIK